MINLAFLSMTVRDFKSYVGEHTLSFADMADGLHYFTSGNLSEPRLGRNGAGKSTLWDALCWCLTGKTVKGLRGPDVKGWGSKASPYVKVVVMVGKHQHVITREASPPSLRIDGEIVEQADVVALIRMDHDILTNTIIMGQGRGLFFDLSPQPKMDLISSAMNLDKWDARAKTASEKAKEYALEVIRFEKEIEGFTAVATHVSGMLKDIEDKAEKWEAELQAGIADSEESLVKLQAHQTSLQKNLDGADLQYDGAMAEMKALEAQIIRLHNDVRTAESNIDRLLSARREGQAKRARWEQELDALSRTKTCPTCGQLVKPADLEKHRADLETKIAEVVDALRKIKVKPYKAALDVSRQALANSESYVRGFRARADGAFNDIRKWGPQLDNVKHTIETIHTQRKLREEARNPFADQARKLRKKRDRLDEDLAAATADRDAASRDEIQARYWIKGFKDVKLQVIEEVMQELEIETAGTLEEIGLVGWTVKYVIERETKSGTTHRGLDIMIGSPKSGGKLVKWESWSGGEAQRLRLVGALALSAVLLNYAGVRPDLEVLDEPTQHLSGEGVTDLLSYLAGRAADRASRICYVDHTAVESAEFASVMYVTMDGDGSRFESEEVRSAGRRSKTKAPAVAPTRARIEPKSTRRLSGQQRPVMRF